MAKPAMLTCRVQCRNMNASLVSIPGRLANVYSVSIMLVNASSVSLHLHAQAAKLTLYIPDQTLILNLHGVTSRAPTNSGAQRTHVAV